MPRGILLVVTMLVVVPVSAPKPGYRTVAMDAKTGVHQEQVRGAPFVLTALVMPEPYTQATCGNCTQKQGAETPENWFLKLAPEEHTLYVRPTRLPSGPHPVASFNTTLHITLASGYRININLGLAGIRGKTPPDAEVAFTLPQSATMAGRLAEEMKKRETTFKAEVQKAAQDQFLRHLMGKVRCEDKVGVPYRTDKLVVRLRQTCSTESLPPTFWVVFEAQNRGDGKLALGNATLSARGAATGSEGRFRFERQALRFDEHSIGIALATLEDGQTAPSEWELVVTEEGGSERQVVVDDVTF
ncbi:hypothetical protein ACFL6C_02780 [Myxococcota bacterium]